MSVLSLVSRIRRCGVLVRLLAVGAICATFGCVFASESLALSEILDVSVAGLYVGQQRTIEAPVTATGRDGNVVHLRLGTPPQSVNVSLVIGAMSDFPPSPEQHYAGKTVRVVATIQSFRGGLEMTIHSAADIQVVDPAHPATGVPTDAAPAIVAPAVIAPAAVAPPSAAEQQRLHQLEERVHQLGVSEPRPEATPTPAAVPMPSAAVEAPADGTPLSEVPAAADLELRLKKIEIRLRHLEQMIQGKTR